MSLALRNKKKNTKQNKRKTTLFNLKEAWASTSAQLQNNTKACLLKYYLLDIVLIVADENLRGNVYKDRAKS